MNDNISGPYNYFTMRLLNAPIFIVGIMLIFFLLLSWHNIPSWNADNGYYIKVSQWEPVRRPFSSRLLYPNMARLIMDITGLSIPQSFIVCNTFALLLFLFLSTHLIKTITSFAPLAIPLLCNPLILCYFQTAYLPDLFFAGLVSLYFVLILHSYFKVSLLILLFLCATREAALILIISMMFVCIYQSKWKLVLSLAIVMVLGIAINSFSARFGLPTPANMNPLLFYFIRIPNNLFYNITGIPIWSNIYADFCHPVIIINIPTWLPFGNLHSIGFCPINITTPFRNLSFYLTIFGVLPSLLFYILFKNYKKILESAPQYIMVALVYGIISFTSAILLSMEIMRYAGHAWPIFWIALIYLFPLYYQVDKFIIYRILIMNLIVSWVPWIVFLNRVKLSYHYQFSIEALPIFLIIVLGSIIIHYYAIQTMRTKLI
jgi:hypothetical protein